MITPARRPTTTENDIPSQFSIPSPHRMKNVAIAIKTELVFVPLLKAPRSCFILVSSFVLTIKIPITERSTPTAAISIGANIALSCIPSIADLAKAAAPRAAASSTSSIGKSIPPLTLRRIPVSSQNYLNTVGNIFTAGDEKVVISDVLYNADILIRLLNIYNLSNLVELYCIRKNIFLGNDIDYGLLCDNNHWYIVSNFMFSRSTI